MAEAQAAGAELLVLPEFACAQWLGFAPVGLPLDQQVPWLASLTEPALAALGPRPARCGVAPLAGTMPTAVGAGRRAAPPRQPGLAPDPGRRRAQPGQAVPHTQRAEPARVAPGPRRRRERDHVAGLRIAVIVCLDLELTALWARLATLDLDLVLVPAETDLRRAGAWAADGVTVVDPDQQV